MQSIHLITSVCSVFSYLGIVFELNHLATAQHCDTVTVSVRWWASPAIRASQRNVKQVMLSWINVFLAEIPSGEEGRRGRVLLPGQERRRPRPVPTAEDGSL